MPEPHESRVYSDLAPFYDRVFGRVFVDREHEVIESLALRPANRVLEVGVGTGISLDAYPPYIHLVGIDPSADMLKLALAKAKENDWRHIELRQGDALDLDFADDCFDVVTSFHVMTVVPDPVRMMSEMVRVCKPGGRVIVVTHFISENPVLRLFTWIMNPVTKLIGWTTRLRLRDVLAGQNIRVERLERFSPLSVHTVLAARKLEA